MATILVIKHGALGDFVQSLGAFEAIRRHHPDDHLVLLTTPLFVSLAQETFFFDQIVIDPRHSYTKIQHHYQLYQTLRSLQIRRVYDLQRSTRSGVYYRALKWRRTLEWSGVVAGCSHPHPHPAWRTQHSLDRLEQQLSAVGINSTAPHFNWLTSAFQPPSKPYIVFIPSASPKHPDKCWPLKHFQQLAQQLTADGWRVIIVGTKAEQPLGEAIAQGNAGVENWMGRTTLTELIVLCQHAAGVVGNDTGPTHIAAIAAAPTVVLFFSASDPKLSAPRGANVSILSHPQATQLTVALVAQALNTVITINKELPL